MSKYDELSALLTIHGQLLGHPKYTALMAQVSKELEAQVASLVKAPAAIPAQPEPTDRVEMEWAESKPADPEFPLRRL